MEYVQYGCGIYVLESIFNHLNKFYSIKKDIGLWDCELGGIAIEYSLNTKIFHPHKNNSDLNLQNLNIEYLLLGQLNVSHLI